MPRQTNEEMQERAGDDQIHPDETTEYRGYFIDSWGDWYRIIDAEGCEITDASSEQAAMRSIDCLIERKEENDACSRAESEG